VRCTPPANASFGDVLTITPSSQPSTQLKTGFDVSEQNLYRRFTSGKLHTQKEDAVTQKEDAATQKKDAVTQKEDAVTQKEDAVTQKKDAVPQKEDAVTQKEDAVATPPVATDAEKGGGAPDAEKGGGAPAASPVAAASPTVQGEVSPQKAQVLAIVENQQNQRLATGARFSFFGWLRSFLLEDAYWIN
jgi:hypothetical protein